MTTCPLSIVFCILALTRLSTDIHLWISNLNSTNIITLTLPSLFCCFIKSHCCVHLAHVTPHNFCTVLLKDCENSLMHRNKSQLFFISESVYCWADSLAPIFNQHFVLTTLCCRMYSVLIYSYKNVCEILTQIQSRSQVSLSLS